MQPPRDREIDRPESHSGVNVDCGVGSVLSAFKSPSRKANALGLTRRGTARLTASDRNANRRHWQAKNTPFGLKDFLADRTSPPGAIGQRSGTPVLIAGATECRVVITAGTNGVRSGGFD
jgi:hypothetical protein